VPTVPGSPGPVESLEEGQQVAGEIGFPVIIKRGRRWRQGDARRQRCRSVHPVVHAGQAGALAAFNSDEVYIEKYLARPRHIEIQIMGDTHGKVMHCASATARSSAATRSS